MNDNKIIAGFLLEIAKNSTTELIEDSKIDPEIIDAAKKMGMILPSPDFAVFLTKWADIGKKNLNNVRLPRKAVEDGIQTLVGKNLNFEHLGAYNVCGFCLSVKIKKDEIESINVFYRSLYPDKFEELKEKIKTKEAAVSFEIYNQIDGKSVIKELEDGTKEITKIHCHGTGLLMCNPPACPTAKIFKLVAKKELKEAEQITNKIFNQDLIYAQLAIEESKCVNCGKCNCEKGGNKVELEKIFANVTKEEEITFDLAMAFYYASDEEQKKLTEDAAKWTRKFINGLPDSAFAAIEPAYPEKVEDKNARHLPHHNGEGDLGKDKSNANLDLPHYKNALARVNQIKPISDSISAEDLQKKASAHLERHKDALEKATEIVQVNIDNKDTKTTVEIVNEKKKVRTLEEYTSIYDTKFSEEGTVTETKSSWKSKYTNFFMDGTDEVNETSGEGENKYKNQQVKSSAETKVEGTPTETKPVEGAETKVEGNKTEETKGEKAQEMVTIVPKVVVKVTRIYSDIYIDTYVDGTASGTSEGKSKIKRITEYADGTKDEVEEESEYKKKFDFAEIEEKVNAAKTEKDAEITTLKSEQEKVITAKDLEIKNLTETKDKEISNLKQELGKKDQEIARLNPISEPEKDKTLEVGNTIVNGEDETTKQAKKINEIIAEKHKK